jgi:hypothetical protein
VVRSAALVGVNRARKLAQALYDAELARLRNHINSIKSVPVGAPMPVSTSQAIAAAKVAADTPKTGAAGVAWISDDAKLRSVEAMPSVKAIVPATGATGAVAAAVNDPNRPKVIDASPAPPSSPSKPVSA